MHITWVLSIFQKSVRIFLMYLRPGIRIALSRKCLLWQRKFYIEVLEIVWYYCWHSVCHGLMQKHYNTGAIEIWLSGWILIIFSAYVQSALVSSAPHMEQCFHNVLQTNINTWHQIKFCIICTNGKFCAKFSAVRFVQFEPLLECKINEVWLHRSDVSYICNT